MKNLLITFTLFSFTVSAYGQTNPFENLELLAGSTSACLSGDGIEGGSLCCLFFGIQAPIFSTGGLGFFGGAQYFGSGNKTEFSGEEGFYSIENSTALTYLNIPVEARYEFGSRGNIKPFVKGGATLGFLLSAKDKSKSTISGQESESETDVKDTFKSTNLSLDLGVGATFPLGKYRGTASVGYGLGLTNVVSGQNQPSAKTRNLTFTLGFGL